MNALQNHKRPITTAFWVVVVLFTVLSCAKEEKETMSAIKNRSVLPRLHAVNISTVISDSGITRYRINTPQWDVYDRASSPYWEFPLGIHLERFDENLKVNANIHCKYAKYLQQQRIWELKGNVKATNLKGELYETELMYWDQNQRKIYTDSLITITQLKFIITSIGFDSDQELNHPTFRNLQGVIPVQE